MFSFMKLLLLEILLINLGITLSIKNHVEEDKIQVATTTFLNNIYPTDPLPTQQYHNHDNYSNSHNTTTILPIKDYDIVEFSPDTEDYTVFTEEFPQNPNVLKINNTNTSEDLFFTEITSDIPKKWWDEIIEESTSPISITTTKGIINYNKTTLPKCPKGLTYLEKQYPICYLITEPTPFPPKCPYPIISEHDLGINVTTQPHWTIMQRNQTELGNKNCFIANTILEMNSIPTNCMDSYPGICPYDINPLDEKLSLTDYCTTRYNKSCFANNMNSPRTCYCIEEAKEEKQPRTAFCKKLVEIIDPYENNVMLKLLGKYKSCWIGLQKFGESYQWSYINSTSNYTFWSKNTIFTKPYGALGSDGWLLEEDGALNCAICEIITYDYPEVQINIIYNKTANTIDVKIINPREVFNQVTCFAQNYYDYSKIDVHQNTNSFQVIPLKIKSNASAYYWCETQQIPDLTPVYSNKIFIPTKYGHEYALLTTFVQPNTTTPPFNAFSSCNFLKYFNMEIDSLFVKISKHIKEKNSFEILCHITVKPTKISRAEELEMLSNFVNSYIFNSTNLRSLEVCLPTTTISGNQTLHWPETPIEATTIPEELCLQYDGSPVTRTCTGNFYYGGQWLEVNGTCADITFSHTTQALNNLLHKNITIPNTLSEAILNITKYTDNFTTFDIHLISKVLEKLVTFGGLVNVTDITKIINNVMHFERNKLNIAQESLNSTDIILNSLDETLAHIKTEESEVTEKLVVQISDLKKTNGIKLGITQNGFDPSKVNSLQHGTSQEDLMKENFELALIIPEQLLNEITQCMGGEKASPKLITTVFYDDVLFSEQNNTEKHPDSRIIGVTIPDFDCTFTTPLQIIFNPSTNNSTQLKCASWEYGINDVKESTRGQWLIEDNPKHFGDSNYQVCEFTHVTHFTLLILGGAEISEGHKKALDIITAIGSGLSILGLLMIFLTAIIFKSFRSANAVVINFSVAMTAQIVLLFIADNIAHDKVLCTVFGAALHYIVLVQFAWMLTIAILQYRRYVVIFSTPSPYLVTISCGCSWGIPLIPIIIITSITREGYGENAHGLCYAIGNYFIFGLLIPVSLIIFINLIIFLRIMLSIASSRKIKVHQKKDDKSSLQLRLAIMLYFLLGLTWGFGLVAAIGGGIVYSYLFCITATLQGFILFLYFIVLNEKTKSLWTNMKTCRCLNKSDEYEINSDSAGTAMIRRPKNTASSDTNTSSTTSEMLRKIKNRNSNDF